MARTLRPRAAEGGYTHRRAGTLRVLGLIVYWLAVLAISLVLLVLLVRFFESRDESEVQGSAVPALPA